MAVTQVQLVKSRGHFNLVVFTDTGSSDWGPMLKDGGDYISDEKEALERAEEFDRIYKWQAPWIQLRDIENKQWKTLRGSPS